MFLTGWKARKLALIGLDRSCNQVFGPKVVCNGQFGFRWTLIMLFNLKLIVTHCKAASLRYRGFTKIGVSLGFQIKAIASRNRSKKQTYRDISANSGTCNDSANCDAHKAFPPETKLCWLVARKIVPQREKKQWFEKWIKLKIINTALNMRCGAVENIINKYEHFFLIADPR